MIDEKLFRKNTRAYLASKVNWLSGCLVAIVGIWIRDDLSFSQMLLLQGLFALLVILMEVPTGIIADMMERKKVLMFGYFNVTAGLVLYAIMHGFNGFLLAELFFAIGLASISGADTAAIWDTYIENGDEKSVNKIIANGKMVMLGSAIVFTIVGGILASYYLTAPLYIAAVGEFSKVIMYGLSYETHREKVDSARTAWLGSLQMFRSPRFREAFLLGLILATILRIAFWAYLPKLADYAVDPFWFGFVYAGANVIAMVTTYLVRNKEDFSSNTIVLAILSSTVGIIFFVVDNSVLMVLIAITLHQVGRGIIGVVMPVRVNQATTSEIRASAMSLVSMVINFSYFVATVSFDLLSMNRDEIMLINAIMCVLIALIWVYLRLFSQTELGLIPISKTLQT